MNQAALLDAVLIEPQQPAEMAVIWLHGLGADGHDFVPIVEAMQLPHDHKIRFIFPHAPSMPVTLNGGMVMPAWYDLYGIDFESRNDTAGLEIARQHIERLIQAQIDAGIAASQIVLVGFSQGGAVSLYTGLRYQQTLAGIMALSSYLPCAEDLLNLDHSANQNTPIFMAHGIYDPVVKLAWGEHSKSFLQKHGYQVEWHTFPMEHNVSPEEVFKIRQWLMTKPYQKMFNQLSHRQ